MKSHSILNDVVRLSSSAQIRITDLVGAEIFRTAEIFKTRKVLCGSLPKQGQAQEPRMVALEGGPSVNPNDKTSLIRKVVHDVFDETPYDWQIEAISAILDGKDVLVSAATGSG